MPIEDAAGNPTCLGCAVGRAGLRLRQDDRGNLLAVAKATGDVYTLDPVDVPEPSTGSLIAAALFSGSLFCRRRSKRRA